MKKRFNLGQAISFSVQSLRKHPMYILTPVAIQTIAVILNIAGNKVYSKLSDVKSPQALGLLPLLFLGFFIATALYFLILTFSQISITRVGFKIFQKDEDPGWKDVFHLDWPLIGKCLSCFLLFGLFVILGLLVCFIPGLILYFVSAKLIFGLRILLISLCAIPFFVFLIILFIHYLFVTSIAVDTRDTVNQIFKKSANLAKGIKWHIFGYLFLMILLPYPITRSIMSLEKLGYVWLYYSLTGIFTFLWASLVAMIPIYLYKDLIRQQTEFDVVSHPQTSEENLAEEIGGEQAEELVEESPEL